MKKQFKIINVSRETFIGEGENMNSINEMINYYQNDIILVLLVSVFLLLIISLCNFIRIGNIQKRISNIFKSTTKVDLDELITSYYKDIEKILAEHKLIKGDVLRITNDLSMCAQKIAIVRYNAFDDVGSDLSYAIAILDAQDNGIVINGVYSRECSNSYAKPIENGKSKYTLSAEEMQAIDLAKKQHSQKYYTLN